MDPVVANQFDDADEELIETRAPQVIRMQNVPQHHVEQREPQNLPQPSPNASPRDSVSVVSSDTFHEEQARPATMMKMYANAPPVPAMVGNSSVSDDSSVETMTNHPPFAIPPGVCKDDVLCGRGKGANNFIGNRRFRELVMQFRDTYSNSSRRADKRVICNQIIDAVRSRGGRFLVKAKHDTWNELEHEKILIKVSQALREGVAKWNKATRQYNELKAKKAAAVSAAPAMALLAEIASIGFPRP